VQYSGLCYIHTLMKVITSLPDEDLSQPSVVSIGNFDGFHLGHREILKTVVQRSRELGCRSIAMTFSPHPVRFLAPARAPKLISTLDQKIRLIKSSGVDFFFIAQFDEVFSRLSPQDFIQRYLIEGLKARTVCLGSNFNFGYRQSGTVETMRQFRPALEVIEVSTVRVRGTLVSSSHIRELVKAGSVSRACRLLGRWVQIEGAIVPGAGRGKSLATPTLNLKPQNELLPGKGVYVTRISLDGLPFLDGVTNVGVRPTFGENQLTVETFVLNDSVPVDAAFASLDFLYRIRDEMKFDSAETLRKQIAKDVLSTEKFFRLLRYVEHHPD
jgi:riboflavin kinase/FMN adenylyltransferase